MSLINSRIHSHTAAHAFLSRAVVNFEASCNRVAKIVHTKAPAVPLASICDAVAGCIDGDTVLAAEFFAPDCNDDFIREVATAVLSTFSRDRGDYEPDQKAIAKAVGSRLAARAFDLLSLSDRLAIVRSLSRDDARALCERRIARQKNAHELSVVSL